MGEKKIGVIHYNFPDMNLGQFLDFCERTGCKYVEVAIGDVWPQDEEHPEKRAEALLA